MRKLIFVLSIFLTSQALASGDIIALCELLENTTMDQCADYRNDNKERTKMLTPNQQQTKPTTTALAKPNYAIPTSQDDHGESEEASGTESPYLFKRGFVLFKTREDNLLSSTTGGAQ